ncbi:MAG TPA: hypothetical protein VN663_22840 [Ramlibacter sp.]|nr:hypothetical protein [Ramlibacter sp.]
MAKFPRAGQHDPKASDPMMKRVNLEHAEIGSRPSGMPKTMDGMPSISHVGDSGKQGS